MNINVKITIQVLIKKLFFFNSSSVLEKSEPLTAEITVRNAR